MTANIQIKMEEDLPDTEDNTQNSIYYMSQAGESQPMIRKEPWGRLYKKRLLRKRSGHSKATDSKNDDVYFDIIGDSYLFGRDSKNCDYVFEKDKEIDLKTWNRISKIHFGLYRNMSREEDYITIKDLSRNGTYINGELIGHNQSRFIKTGDVISIIEHDMKIFDFKDLILRKLVDLPDFIQTKYFVGPKLGSGAFGQVYKLYDRKMQSYAVKYIKTCSLMPQQSTTDNEIKILEKINHVCIIKTYDILKDRMGGASLVLEYMEGGDLLNRILNSPQGKLNEDNSRFIFFQVTEAINYLHKNSITHRDIKPDNVLLKDSTDWPLVKLTDFGLSKLVVEGTVMKSLIGTPNYVAPEVLSADDSKYTSKVDVWSMGVMLFAMLSGSLPFAENYGNVHKQILSGRFGFIGDNWDAVSGDAKRLIKKMLKVNPENRIGIKDIFEIPWMDVTHNGIRRAIYVIQKHGETIPRSRQHIIQFNKENEFVRPRPPLKRPRNNL